MARKSDIRLRRSAVSGSIPTTSNLNLGELALNTADGKVYMKKSVGGTDTVIEVGAGGGIAASFIAYEYTATANQTTFSGSDNNSNTLAYNTGTPPSVQVFMNGILLDEGSSQDYTGTNGTSVVLTTAADAGDLIQIHAYKSDVSIVSDLSFADNQKLKFGDSNDLQIYHDGNNSRVEDTGTGGLRLIGGNFVSLQSTSGENMVVATENGAVTLYNDNSAKLATTSSGVQITGTLDVDVISNASGVVHLNDTLYFQDNSKAVFGDSSDLQIFHNGTESRIEDSGTGNLVIKATNLELKSYGTNEAYLTANQNGAVTLYYDNSAKLATTTQGINVTGLIQAEKIQLNASGSDNPQIQLNNNDFATFDWLVNQGDNGKFIVTVSGTSGAEMELSSDGSDYTNAILYVGGQRVLTQTAGINLTGNLGFNDNVKALFGTNHDLEIYHDGSNSYIKDAGTGDLQIQATGSTFIKSSDGTKISAQFAPDSYTRLYYNNAIKLQTTSTGIDVTGEVQADSLDIDGLSVLTSNNVSAAVTIERANATSNQVGIQFSAGNSRYFGKGTDDEPYWATSANLTAGSKIVTAGNFTGILDSTYYQSGDNISVGTISSGAITSSGAIVGSSVQSTGNLFGTNGLHTLNTAGNGWDHTINRNGGSPTANLPGGITSGNITTTGYLRGPSTFTIDPAAHGDDTGTVVIAGNLQIDGTTTTINSTTLTVDDKNITLASGSANAAAANGAGLTVDCGSDTDTTFTFNGTSAQWETNTELVIKPRHTSGTPPNLTLGDLNNQYQSGIASSGHLTMRAGGSGNLYWQNAGTYLMMMTNAGDLSIGNGTSAPTNHRVHIKTAVDDSVAQGLVIERSANNDRGYINYNGGGFQFRSTVGDPIVFGETDAEHMRIVPDGNVGIGTTHPDSKLDVTGGDITVNTTGTGFMNFKYTNSSKGTIGTDGIDLKITAVADLQLLPTGNVGIGTSSPGRKLTVQGASGDNLPVRIIGGSGTSHGSMEFQDPNTTADYKVTVGSKGDDFYIQAGGGEKVRVKSGGNVGIGTTNPLAKLDVEAGALGGTTGNTTTAAVFRAGRQNLIFQDTRTATGTDWNNATFKMIAQIDSTNHQSIDFVNDSSFNEHIEILTGNQVFNTRFTHDGKVGIGTRSPSAPLHVVGSDSGIKISSAVGDRPHLSLINGTSEMLRLSANNLYGAIGDSTDGQRYMTLKSGNVGIGITAPQAKLHVDGTTIFDTATGSQPVYFTRLGNINESLKIHCDDRGAVFESIQDETADTYGNFIFAMDAGVTEPYFDVRKGSADSASIFRVDGGGNVGIGETAPTHKLHVAGDIRIDNGSALKLYNSAGNGWAQIAYNNTLDHIEIQRSFQSSTDSYYNLGSSAKKWLSVYSDTIKAGNGTPAAPTYTFDSDQNTGMYIDGTADTLRFSTGGAQRMFLNNAGITSASNVYTGSAGEFRNYGGTWKATTGTAAGDFEFRGNTGGTNTGLMYMDTSTGRVAVGNGFNSTNVKSEFQVNHAGIDTYAVNTSATSAAQVDTFPAGDFRSARFTVQITNTTDSTYQITEILLIHDGTTPAMTEYSTIFTGSAREASFDADIVSGNVRLLATPASTDSMQFKVVRHSILV